jgi:hypothetical protein
MSIRAIFCIAAFLVAQAWAVRAEEKEAPTYEECDAMPESPVLVGVEKTRCQILAGMYRQAFKAGKAPLFRWTGPIRIYLKNSPPGMREFVEQAAAKLSAPLAIIGGVSVVDESRQANLHIFFLDDVADIAREENIEIIASRVGDKVAREVASWFGGGREYLSRHWLHDNKKSGATEYCLINIREKTIDQKKKSAIRSIGGCAGLVYSETHYRSMINNETYSADIYPGDELRLEIIYKLLRPKITWAEAKPIINLFFDIHRRRIAREQDLAR